ncbi:hypothetical protein Gotri_020526 [Gossypium trilobum]|uniref:Uncharacterized protein n=1 Tax=Gossypium trilobum TaxID=34281 RepID=A0A7J9DAD9_9ROSI|nr:hypothetical protein [Gossypium trilobum]
MLSAGVWDAVVTCFFIDTAHNIIEYIEIISRILKEGGVSLDKLRTSIVSLCRHVRAGRRKSYSEHFYAKAVLLADLNVLLHSPHFKGCNRVKPKQ